MKLTDTMIPEMYTRGLFEELGLDLAPEHFDKITDVTFTSVANLLNQAKSMNNPTAFTLKAINGSLVAAAVVQYFPNQDASNPGNWSLIWTFNEADIPENALKIDISDPKTHSYIRVVAGEKYGMKFETTSDVVNLPTYALQIIKKFLDENAKEGQIISVEQAGVFQARVSVENGEKVFAIEADGEVKNLIKDDAAIEK